MKPGLITWVALLRGINVGRARPVGMADLREAVESLGFDRVRTLLRSGNVVFEAPSADPAAVGTALEGALEKRFSMSISVVVRTAAELAAVVEASPFDPMPAAGTYLHVLFLGRSLSASERSVLEPARFLPDEVRLVDREIYVWYRHGTSGSKTADRLFRMLPMPATDRNWNTVSRLLRLAQKGS